MRNRQWRFVHPARRAVQWSVLLALCLLPWLNMHEWTRVYGSFFALDVYGIPFSDPVSVFWPLAHGGVPIRLWLGAGLTLALALLVGRVFCGWLCPYGLLSEYAYAAHHKVQACLAAPAPTAALPAFGMRAVILGLGIAANGVFASPVVQWLSMPGSLSLIPLHWWYGAENALAAILLALLLPAGVLALEALTGLRLWCRWLCPQAVLLSLAARLGQPFMHVRWNADKCQCPSGHRPCASACSMALRPRQQGGPQRGECTQCAACVAACHGKGTGALRVGVSKPKKTLHGA